MSEPERTVLILQHEPTAPADMLAEWLRAREITYETVPVWEQGLPGDAGTWEWICSLGSDETPNRSGAAAWVDAEVAFLRAALAAGIPVLGLCFGGQALAVAAGGGVHPADPPAAGWAEVETSDPGLVSPGPWLHFHYDQLEPPPEATVIARSPAGVAAFTLGRSLGLQFHPETGPAVVAGWAESERERLTDLSIDPAGVAEGGRRLGSRPRDLAFNLFDAWRARLADDR